LGHEAGHLLHVHLLVDKPTVVVVPVLVDPLLAGTGTRAGIKQPLGHLGGHDFVMLA